MWAVVVPAITLIAVIAPSAFSQTNEATRPSFEVATIKPNNPDGRQMIIGRPGGRVSIVGATVKVLVATAYRVRDFQVIGGPNWINTERFDIEAKAEEGANRQGQAGLLMMQSLLADRFQLKIHTETRELPLYELFVSKWRETSVSPGAGTSCPRHSAAAIATSGSKARPGKPDVTEARRIDRFRDVIGQHHSGSLANARPYNC